MALTVLIGCSPAQPETQGFAEAAAIGHEIAAEEVMPWVDRLCAEHATDVRVSCQDNPPEDGYPACDLSRNAAIRMTEQAFRALGLKTETVVLGAEPYAAFNVVAEWAGSSRSNEVVLLGAHLDAFFQGADDNASGVAALLEAARALTRHRFARTLRFVAFDLEELRSTGATRYVETGRADDVVAALILDAVGFASSAPGSQESPTGVPLGTVGDFILAVGNDDSAVIVQRMMVLAHAHELIKMRGVLGGGDGTFPLTGVLMRSDHGPFWLRGLPALLLTDTANFRNPHYHRASDTPDTLDPDFLVRVTRLLTASAALFAEVQP
jgi:hypothetical protein